MLCATVLNAVRGKTGKRYKPSDFLPKPLRPHGPRKLTGVELLNLHKFFTKPD